MNNTIASLQAELEELEKRIKALSTSQSTLSHLTEIKNYFEKMQEYLALLNKNFNDHTISCENFAEEISNLKNQIALIQEALKNVGTNGNFNSEEIESRINTLTLNLNNVIEQLSTLKGGSDATIAQLERDIDSFQIDLGYAQDSLEEITTELSEINTYIGDQQTQINNLSSTQNTLTTAQSALSSRVSGIDNRLTTAEANISTLTGGVDLSEFNKRLSDLENADNYSNPIFYQKESFNISPTDFTLYTPEYSYLIDNNYYTQYKCKITYEATNGGTLKILAYYDENNYNKIIIDLTKYPNEYEYTFVQLPNKKQQIVKYMFIATANIKYKEMEISILGKGIRVFDYNKDLQVHCFNNQLFITQKNEDGISYGLFGNGDSFDLSNLPNTYKFQNESGTYIYALYCPYYEPDTSSKTISNYTDALIIETTKAKRYVEPLYNIPTTSSTLTRKQVRNLYHNYNFGVTQYPSVYGTREDGHNTYNNYFDSYSYMPLTQSNNNNIGKFYYCFGVRNNNSGLGISYISQFLLQTVGLREDGYFYFLNGQHPKNVLKLCKGTTATAYLQTDGSINAYISTFKDTFKYSISLNSNNEYEATYISCTNDCDCIYEIFNNKTINHKVSNNTWSVV